MATNDMKARLIAEQREHIGKINASIAKATNAEVEKMLEDLVKCEKEFLSIRENEVYASLETAEDAIRLNRFSTISHKKTSENGKMTGVEYAEKLVQVDLHKFCDRKGFPMEWYYEMQALNKRLTLKVARSVGMSTDELRKISDSYSMEKLAAEIDLGKTPDSNTQVVKHMQLVLDLLAPESGKVNNYDLAFLMSSYTKRSNRESLKVVCSKHSLLQSILTDVFYRVLTDKAYGVDYKRKPDTTGAAVPAAAPAAEKVAEKETVAA